MLPNWIYLFVYHLLFSAFIDEDTFKVEEQDIIVVIIDTCQLTSCQNQIFTCSLSIIIIETEFEADQQQKTVTNILAIDNAVDIIELIPQTFMIISVKFNVKNNEDVIIILHLTIVLAVYDHKLTFLLARIAHHHFK